MRISIFGNPDYEPDSLPLKLLPHLKKKFPGVDFVITDPNELSMPNEKNWYCIDSVKGLKKVTVLSLDDIKKLTKNKVSLHDFDLGMHLFWAKKLKKDLQIKIIGIPPSLDFNAALKAVVKILAKLC